MSFFKISFLFSLLSLPYTKGIKGISLKNYWPPLIKGISIDLAPTY